MPFQLTLLPQMRDSDPDGLIGLRGVMRNFQNIHQWYMHRIHKGNDELPKAYGAAWIYTRYHVTVDEKIDHSSDIRLTAWMEGGYIAHHAPHIVLLPRAGSSAITTCMKGMHSSRA